MLTIRLRKSPEVFRLEKKYVLTPKSDSKWHSLITYDMGGKWTKLAAPADLCQTPELKNDCYLSLYGRTSGLPILSPPQAVGSHMSNLGINVLGLILGIGAVSDVLHNPIGVFFSRDAGKSGATIKIQ